MVRVAVSRREPMPIRVQVSEQIKHQIEEGTLVPGSRLPTVREFAADLHINYNTVRGIYVELEREGYITSEQGRGTFVAPRPPRSAPATGEVRDMVDDALSRAVVAGISADDFARLTYTRAKLFRPRRRRPRILFTECNESELRDFAEEIRTATGVEPVAITLQSLKKKKSSFFDDIDVFATTFPHVAEMQRIIGDQRSVIGVMLEPGYREVVADIAKLPSKMKVGLLCSSQAAADAMKRSVEAAGLHDREFIAAGSTALSKLKHADRIYVSRRYVDEHGDAPDFGVAVRPYEIHLTPASLRFLRQQLEEAVRPGRD